MWYVTKKRYGTADYRKDIWAVPGNAGGPIMPKRRDANDPKKPGKEWELRLYVAGETAKTGRAIDNLKKICEEYLKGQYHIEVIDLLKTPKLAAGDQIFAVPTLVRKIPEPMRKIIGDLSVTDKVLVGLDILPAE